MFRVEYKVVEKTKDGLEVELDDKTIAAALVSELNDRGVDAASYDPHPLFPAARIIIKSKSGEKDLKAAVSGLEKNVASLKKSVL